MANICHSKRKHSSSKPLDMMSSRLSSPDLLNEMKSSQSKRRRLSSTKPENESSMDSFSHYNPSDSEGSSDSEFEEHPYSRSTLHLNKINYHSRSKFKSDQSIHTSQFGSNVKESKRSKCTSKNAVMARLNRLKKKKYIEDLESKNAELEAENQMLKNMLDMRAKEVESLKRKTSNLESVIRNKTEIGSLLKCVRQHTDLEISSSLLRNLPDSPPIVENVRPEKPSSTDLHELETSLSEEEGNDILNLNAKTVGTPLGFLDFNEDTDIDLDISNPLLSDVDSWFKPNRFEFPESPESAGYGGVISPSRCETPSKGFADCSNKENLFSDVGVCFHIANKKVSLEFCDSCNHMASQ